METAEISEGIRDYLEFLRDEGVDRLEITGAAALPDRENDVKPESARKLDEIARGIRNCVRCSLSRTRNRTVPGNGCATPEVVFVGEAPGADEDRQGEPFVGAAGRLLTKMIEAMGYKREDVFICNILKCRPPGNRAPTPDEMEVCLPYLRQQLAVLRPKVIVALGATAVKGLMGPGEGITKLRGRWMTYEGVDLMPTYHPAYLLRNPSAKKDVWEDLKAVLKRVGRKPPPVRKHASRSDG